LQGNLFFSIILPIQYTLQTLSDAKNEKAKLQKKRAINAKIVGLLMHTSLVGIVWKSYGRP
jgi:hypothetical protein